MEMLSPGARMIEPTTIRPTRRVEFEKLAAEGCYDDERVELLFGMVVEMRPLDATHNESVYQVHHALKTALGDRAKVLCQSAFAASDISEPQPDVFVVPSGQYWDHNPTQAYLVIEVARTSINRDRGPKALLYGASAVDEYWIVNILQRSVEVYRDRHDGQWRTKSVHMAGETIAMLRFPDVQIQISEIVPPRSE